METADKYLTEGKSYKFGKFELKILERIEGGKKTNDFVIKKSGGAIRINDEDTGDFHNLLMKLEDEWKWGT